MPSPQRHVALLPVLRQPFEIVFQSDRDYVAEILREAIGAGSVLLLPVNVNVSYRISNGSFHLRPEL